MKTGQSFRHGLFLLIALMQCFCMPAADVETAGKDLIAWIASLKDGHFNDKQELVDGIKLVASKVIQKGELLLKVPATVMLVELETDADSDIRCGLVHRLLHEMENIDESDVGPYMKYLKAQRRHQIPSDFTKFGKEMLSDLLSFTPELPPDEPYSWLEDDWLEGCQGDPSDDNATHAAMLYVQMQYSEGKMVPIFDLYRHRNGHQHYNTKTVMGPKSDGDLQVYASRDIQAGEELHHSIDDSCNGNADCLKSYEFYGAAEIFRDFGIVNDFPQRWIIDPDSIAFDLVQNETTGEIDVQWRIALPHLEGYLSELTKRLESSVVHLHTMRSRAFNLYLDQVQNWEEWDLIWKYQTALANALAYAHNEIDEVEETHYLPLISSDGEVCRVDSMERDGQCFQPMTNHYDDLEDEPDDLDYISPSCDNREWLSFEGYEALDDIQTSYQHAYFHRKNATGDVCMDIDDIVQICSSYRPHYHEYSANYAARFLDSVERVLFVGGGDSMLLHEALKYKNLKKVVGLELDQVITRKSFKYFHTQPHFDDDRVEWWFGDATKSLLLLSKDYWQSFDLVLVDLSETAMALSVTVELDVFAALALLLKPEGIMVKNELYIEEMSNLFDYTVQIKYDTPKICSQIMALGSNRADFFRKLQTDHGVHNHLLGPVEEMEDRFEHMHDYRKNDARTAGKCDLPPQATEVTEQGRSAGIQHILDIEYVKGDAPLDSSLMEAAEKVGLNHLRTQTSTDGSTSLAFLAFEEGYILARYWAEISYVSIDVNLWGAFDTFDDLQTHLLTAFKSKSLSSFRVVVGGMYGSSTWREDQPKIGPQVVQFRDCEEKTVIESSGAASNVSGVVEIAVEELLNIASTDSTPLTVGVVCGYEDGNGCVVKDVLEKLPIISKVVTFWTCPNLIHVDEVDEEDELNAEELSHIFECEKAMIAQLKEALREDATLDVFALDMSANLEMVQIFNSIWGLSRFHESYIDPDKSIFFGMSSNSKGDSFHHNFFDRYRKEVMYDPAAHVKFLMQSHVSSSEIELNVVVVGDDSIFQSLSSAENKMNARLKSEATSVELTEITGAQWLYREKLELREFSQTDYDEEPGKLQYSEQRPLGRETLLQFNLFVNEYSTIPSIGLFGLQLRDALPQAGFTEIEYSLVDSVGEGGLISYLTKEGSLIIVWDGRHSMDFNLFRFDDSADLADSFAEWIIPATGNILTLALRDDFPRGAGRVVNFQSDITSVSSS